jgi:hypothetical protein
MGPCGNLRRRYLDVRVKEVPPVNFTAKVKVTNRVQAVENGDVSLSFAPDYGDGRNAEWAAATPALSLSMTVKADVGQYVEMGDEFTLTFTNDTAARHDAESDAEASEGDDPDETPPNAGSVL